MYLFSPTYSRLHILSGLILFLTRIDFPDCQMKILETTKEKKKKTKPNKQRNQQSKTKKGNVNRNEQKDEKKDI